MLEGQPSRTAMGAAAHRAIHQIVDAGRVLSDPLAGALRGGGAVTRGAWAEQRPQDRGLRFFIAARSELAEAKLAEAVEQRGVRQLVLLGAGLDTFAYRNPFRDRLTVYEIDYPSTQQWKIGRLSAANIAAPSSVHFVPVDFEHTSFLAALSEAGFAPDKRSFFTWLGTVPYLTGEAVSATLHSVGVLPGGAEIVFDYAEAVEPDAPGADGLRDLATRVAAAGEPFLTWFDPEQLAADMEVAGFAYREDFNVRQLAERHSGPDTVAARARAGSPVSERGGHVCYGRTR